MPWNQSVIVQYCIVLYAFVLDAMGQHLTKIVNVTIYYPDGIPSFLDFICGKVKHIHVDIDVKDVSPQVIGDYFNDKVFKHNFQQWVNGLWLEKDEKLKKFHQQ